MSMIFVLVVYTILKDCSSNFYVRNCDTEIHTSDNDNLDLVINCATSEKYSKCQLREYHNLTNYDMCIFKLEPDVGLTKPHCTTRTFRTKLYWKYDQIGTNCRLKILNIVKEEKMRRLVISFKHSRYSNEWISRNIEMNRVQSNIMQLSSSTKRQPSVSCHKLKVKNKLNSGDPSSVVYGVYDFQGTLSDRPVFRKKVNFDQEIYLYWNSREAAWVFSPGIGSNAIIGSSLCYDIDPTKCKDWTEDGHTYSGIIMYCNNTGVTILPKLHKIDGWNKTTAENPDKGKPSSKETLFGLIGSCTFLFIITIVVGIIFSRKRRKKYEQHKHGSSLIHRRSLVEFYQRFHVLIHTYGMDEEKS